MQDPLLACVKMSFVENLPSLESATLATASETNGNLSDFAHLSEMGLNESHPNVMIRQC
jgi:hypothetical protein